MSSLQIDKNTSQDVEFKREWFIHVGPGWLYILSQIALKHLGFILTERQWTEQTGGLWYSHFNSGEHLADMCKAEQNTM